MYRLQAAKLALEAKELSQASGILSSISPRVLTAGSGILYLEYQALLSLARNDPDRALEWLSSDLPLSQADRLQFSELRAQAFYQARRYLASARERIFYDALLDDGAQNAEPRKDLAIPDGTAGSYTHQPGQECAYK